METAWIFGSSKLHQKKYAETTWIFRPAKLHRKSKWKLRGNSSKFGLRRSNVISTWNRRRFNVVCSLGSGVHCSCWWWYFAYTLESFLDSLLFCVVLWPWTNNWGYASDMPMYCNYICKSRLTLTDSNIFGYLVSWSKSKLKYNTELSNSLNWKPSGAINSFKFWKILIISWNVDNLSEMIFFWKDCK